MLRTEFFESVRMTYQSFDSWLTKCKREHRQAWVIRATDGMYAGVAIVNREDRPDFGAGLKTLKICMFKISDGHSGFRYGELLLRDVLQYTESNGFGFLFVEVFPEQERLIAFLAEFGFSNLENDTERGEIRLGKRLAFTEHESKTTEPLEFNKQFGPFAIKWRDASLFIVPIKPKYHDLLFPEATTQATFFEGGMPCGNALRKAYLCNSICREIRPGAILAFYRSGDVQGLTVLGVAEETMASGNATEIARFVGKRTVYPLREIERLCQRDVLAILFRQSRVLSSPIMLDKLLRNEIIAAAPQSITGISKIVARKWLKAQIDNQQHY